MREGIAAVGDELKIAGGESNENEAAATVGLDGKSAPNENDAAGVGTAAAAAEAPKSKAANASGIEGCDWAELTSKRKSNDKSVLVSAE